MAGTIIKALSSKRLRLEVGEQRFEVKRRAAGLGIDTRKALRWSAILHVGEKSHGVLGQTVSKEGCLGSPFFLLRLEARV